MKNQKNLTDTAMFALDIVGGMVVKLTVIFMIAASLVGGYKLLGACNRWVKGVCSDIASVASERISEAWWGGNIMTMRPDVTADGGKLVVGYNREPGLRNQVSVKASELCAFVDSHIEVPAAVEDDEVAKVAASFSRTTSIPLEYIGYVGPEDWSVR